MSQRRCEDVVVWGESGGKHAGWEGREGPEGGAAGGGYQLQVLASADELIN